MGLGIDLQVFERLVSLHVGKFINKPLDRVGFTVPTFGGTTIDGTQVKGVFPDETLDPGGKEVGGTDAGGEVGIQGLGLGTVAEMKNLPLRAPFNVGEWARAGGYQANEEKRAPQGFHAALGWRMGRQGKRKFGRSA